MRRKRSKCLTLLLMGSLAAGPAACTSDGVVQEQIAAFASVAECAASGLFDAAQCKQFEADAMSAQPKFASQEECEQQLGAEACMGGQEVQEGSGSFWMPAMAGFLAGHLLSGGTSMSAAQPLYQDRRQSSYTGSPRSYGRSNWQTSSGHSFSAGKGGLVENPPAAVRSSLQHTAKPLQTRSGFGRSGGFSGSSRFGGVSS